MTTALYLTDSYLQEFTAKVIEGEGNTVVLDQSAFYPESGGQPTDTGTLTNSATGEEYKVSSAKKLSGKMMLELDHVGLAAGDSVTGRIDWERRYRFMRSHTAAHLLSEVIHKATAARITGNQISEEKIRIDFDLESFDREAIRGYFEEANALIQKGMPVKTSFMPRDEALQNPDLFSLRNVLPPEITELRIVEIEGFDIKACGGCHVKNIAEIKGLAFIGAENKGKSNRRISFRLIG